MSKISDIALEWVCAEIVGINFCRNELKLNACTKINPGVARNIARSTEEDDERILCRKREFSFYETESFFDRMRFLLFTVLFTLSSRKKRKQHTVLTVFSSVAPIQDRNYAF